MPKRQKTRKAKQSTEEQSLLLTQKAEAAMESAMADWEVTKKIFETENQGVVILVFKTKSCAEQVYEEMVKMLGSQRLL